MARPDPVAAPRPGAALRALRVERGWTLADVSERTSLPVSTLSKIENDRVSLSYDRIAQIGTGLGVDIARLFAPPRGHASTGRRSVTRAGEGRVLRSESATMLLPADDLLHKHFAPAIIELHATSLEAFGSMHRHVGEAFLFVLEGVLQFFSELYAPLTLHEGDSLYFDATMAHAWVKAGDMPCRILTIR